MIFDAKRVYLIARKDFFFTRKQFILVPSTITAFGLFIGMLAGKSMHLTNDFFLGFFGGILYLSGLILTSSTFKDRHNSNSIHNWLMLPASTFEKFLVRFLFSTAGIIIGSALTCWICSLLTGIANAILYKQSLTFFNPFRISVWHMVQAYLALQPLFFLGAAWFRKNHFLKTILTLFILQIFLSLVSGGLGYMFLYRFLKGNFNSLAADFFLSHRIMDGRILAASLRILLQGIIPVSCWAAAYFRLKEAEVKDGV